MSKNGTKISLDCPFKNFLYQYLGRHSSEGHESASGSPSASGSSSASALRFFPGSASAFFRCGSATLPKRGPNFFKGFWTQNQLAWKRLQAIYKFTGFISMFISTSISMFIYMYTYMRLSCTGICPCLFSYLRTVRVHDHGQRHGNGHRNGRGNGR